MRVLICGGRNFADKMFLKKTLDAIHAETPITCIIHGSNKKTGSKGADRLAMYWAGLTGVKKESYEADWDLHGRKAGPIRNTEMLEKSYPDLGVAFQGGPGTADMVKKMKAANVKVIEVRKYR
jgi:YspA, cpYpsA-related SLOG family